MPVKNPRAGAPAGTPDFSEVWVLNYTHSVSRHEDQLEQLAIRADTLWAQVIALQCLADVLVVRASLAAPAWEADLDHLEQSTGYQLRSMKLDGLAPDRAEMILEFAQACIDAKLAEFRRMFELRDQPKPGDWDF